MNKAQRTGSIAAIALALAAAAAFGLRASPAQAPAPATDASSAWPMYQRYATHNAVFDTPKLHANWQSQLGDRINAGFALNGGTLYAASFDHKLYALEAATGKILWSAATDDVLMSTPVFAQGLIIVGSGQNGFLKPLDGSSQVWGRPQGNGVFAFSLDGKPVWTFHTVGENMPSPAIAGDTVVFGNGDAHAYALDLATGKLKWQKPLAGAVTMASTAIDGGAAFVSSCHNAPYYCETRALDLRDGHTLWTNPNGGSDCAPTVADGLVFVNSNRNDETRFHTGGVDIVAAIDETTGQTRWTYAGEPGPYTFPVTNERQIAATFADGVLYQPIGNTSNVIAFEARTGKVLWNLRTWANVKMSPLITGGRVYFGDTGGILYNVDQQTGRVVHTSSFLQPFSAAPPLIAGDTIVFAVGPVIIAMPVADV